MTKFSHFSLKLRQVGLLIIDIGVLDKFQEETIKVSFNIYTLMLIVVVLVDEHEIRVDFKSTTGAHHDANLVILTGARVFLGDGAVLDEL